MVVFWPLGIWMASQSRVNVNSVFSYMALPFANYYATKGENDEIRMTNDETISNDRMTIGSACVLPSLLRHSAFVLRHFLIHIPLVALLAFQLLDVFVGLIDGFTTVLLHNFAQGRINVLRHAA